MASLTVVVAPLSQRDVLSVLADWSASALAHPFAWIEDPPTSSTERFTSLWLEKGRLRRVGLAEELTNLRPDLVRLVVIVPGTEGASPLAVEQEDALIAVVTQATSRRPVVVRLVVSSGTLSCSLDEVAHRGVHNVLLAPEVSPEPGGSVSLPEAATSAELAGHVAAGVATLGALWPSTVSGPLDTRAAPPEGWPQLFRTHVRGLLGHSAEAAIRSETLSTATRNPLPTTRDGSEYIEDVDRATGDFASALIREHQALLASARQKVTEEGVKRIGLGQALKMLFSFLASALDPVAWVKAQIAGAVAAAEEVLGKAIFGAHARFAISLTGPLDERLASLDALDKGLDGVRPRTHEAAGSFAALWKDFVAGAFTLIDGGERVPDLSAIRIGGKVGVLRTAAQCAPAGDTDFVVDPSLGLAAELSAVAAADYLSFVDLGIQLKARADDGLITAATELDRLTAWRREHEKSYTARIGTLLGKQIAKLSAEIDGYLSQLAPQETDDLQRLTRMQRRLSRRLIWLLIIAVVLVLIGILGGVLAVFTWTIAAIIIVVTAVAWLGGSLLVFVKGQKALFAELNRRQTLVNASQALAANLQAASRDLRMCIDAYKQFQSWSDIVATVLAEPFGRPEESRKGRQHHLVGLPTNVRVGELELPSEPVLQTAVRLRRFFFRTGWLAAIWDVVLADVGHHLGAEAAIDFLETPERIYSTRATVDDPLPVWAASLQVNGIGSATRDEAWQRMASELSDKSDEYGLSRVGQVVEGAGSPVGAVRFVERLVDPRVGGDFDIRLLTSQGVVQGAARVDPPPWISVEESVLTRMVVRAEFGPGFSPGVLAVADVPMRPRPRGALVTTNIGLT